MKHQPKICTHARPVGAICSQCVGVNTVFHLNCCNKCKIDREGFPYCSNNMCECHVSLLNNTQNNRTLRDKISEILVKWNMGTKQVAISEIMNLMNNQPIKSCLGIDCPERKSLCCGAVCTISTADEGTSCYICSECEKEFIGGKCTAGNKYNDPNYESDFYRFVKENPICSECHIGNGLCEKHCDRTHMIIDDENPIVQPIPVQDWRKNFEDYFEGSYGTGFPVMKERIIAFISHLLITEQQKLLHLKRHVATINMKDEYVVRDEELQAIIKNY